MVVQSQNGDAAQCVIDCEGSAAAPHRGFHCHSHEGLGSQVRSVTIRNGWHEEGGGALCENASSPIFDLCVFESNAASYGGGLYCNAHSSPEVTDCVFRGNAAQYHGGGISCTSSASFRLESTIVACNASGGSVYCSQCASASLKCCDVFQNAPVNVPPCIQQYFGTGQPNMTLDPRFCGASGSGNVELRSDSPCLPGNHPRYLETCGLIGARDLGCGTISVEPATWGTIKSIYR